MALTLATLPPRESVPPAFAPPASGVRLPGRGASLNGLDDADLVLAAWSGDPLASPTIWRRYQPLVRRRLRLYFDGAELDDCVQEVFARAFQSLPRLREPASLRSFLIGISLRFALVECRRRRLRSWLAVTPTGELPEMSEAEGGDDEIERRLVAARTREIFGQLKPDSVHVLELRFIRGHELTEVAASLGVSLATAKRHLAKATARVRDIARREPVVAEYVREACTGSPGRNRAF